MRPPTLTSSWLCLLAVFVVVGCARSAEVASDAPESVPVTTEIPGAGEGGSESSVPAERESAPTTSTVLPIAADDLPPVNTPAGLVPENYDGRLLTYAYVIEEGDGPVLCTPAISVSDPPQCDGASIAGLDWEMVEHEERRGTRWGQYVVIGHWHEGTFTVTDPPIPIESLQLDFPAGGSATSNPSDPSDGESSAAELSESDLNEIERQVIELSFEIAPVTGILGTAVADGEVQVGVWLATEEAQTRLDEQFGVGVVRLMGLLWAID